MIRSLKKHACQLFFSGVAAACLLVLFIKAQPFDPDAHNRLLDDFHEVQIRDAELGEAVLQIHDRLISDYDALVAIMQRMQVLGTKLSQHRQDGLLPDTPEVRQELSALQQQIEQKETALEQFKSNNAVIKNSFIYLPRGVNITLAHLPKTEVLRREKFELLLRDALLISVNPSEHARDILKQDIRAVERIIPGLPERARLWAKLTLQHANLIFEHEKEMSDLLLILRPSIGTGLEQLYQNDYQARQRTAAQYRLLLFVAAILMLAYAVYTYYRMREKEQQLEQALTGIKNQQHALDEHAIVSIADMNGAITYVNPKFEAISGYSREQLLGQNHRMLNSGHYDKDFFRELWRTVVNGAVWHGQMMNRARDGSFYWIDETIVPFEDDAGKLYQFVSVGTDITAQKQMESDLRRNDEQLNALIEAIPDAILLKDGDGRWLIANEPTKQMYKLHDIPWQGKTSMELAEMQPVFRSAYGLHQASDEKAWQSGQLLVDEESLAGKEGQYAIMETRKMPIFSADGQRKGLVVISRDITQRKQDEAHIHNLAFYDPLTHLPNRRLLMDRLSHIKASRTRTSAHCAMLFVDLDNFKTLNDTKGHDVGDLMLVEVARRMQACTREGDTVARLSGDEFVIILENLSEQAEQAADQAKAVGEKVRAALSRLFLLQDFEYHGSCSIGISMFDCDDMVDDPLKHADTAMYVAKTSGRNALCFFDPAMQAALEARSSLEADLRSALFQQQFNLLYQVQVNASGQPVGAEVLLRWMHPERGLVMPLQFIPVSEKNSLILPIGQWVLETACAQLKAWEADPLAAKLQLAVNVSARQFHQPGFVEQVCATLEKTGANPARLKLELTESVVLDNVNDTVAKMNNLKGIGVCFSLDDFGTGYSSLAYLTQLPLDQLKIDQSFVRNIGTKPTDAVIVQTIIGMANSLEMEVIAEGVETHAQHAFLQHAGCTLYQGFLFSKPMTIDAFTKALLRGGVPQTGR